MSIATIIAQTQIALEPIIEEAKEWATKAVDFLKDVAIAAVQKGVALIKETSLGTAIMNLVSALSLQDGAGADKFNGIITAVQGAYNAFVSAGGLTGLIAEGVSILRQVIQMAYDDFKQNFAAAA